MSYPVLMHYLRFSSICLEMFRTVSVVAVYRYA